ncbi:ABC tran and/or AAA 25 domain containing protein [Asbolus verrucosus]|uniref:ABC tran and/or AAA 25 domain containing protein n=1 Tax=Asbolus verrucosus TaxID=1661398 RepID=A0A482VL39_ASBVE|nr:ABC tran and/or AAA 25 domain containing protein [Asbolus verrucosus]
MEDYERTANKKKLKAHPKQKANFLSNFLWQLPLLYRGFKKGVSEDDLYDTLEEHQSKSLGDKLEQAWDDEVVAYEKPSIVRALIRTFGLQCLAYGLFMFPFHFAFTIFQPLFLMNLLNIFSSQEGEPNQNQAYFYASMMILASLSHLVCLHFISFLLDTLAMKVRVACSSLIYRKSLNLRKTHSQKTTVGQILNFLSNDVNHFETFFAFIHHIWITPIEVIVSLYLLDTILGHAAVVVYLSKRISTCKSHAASKTDYRIRLMNEIICGIKVIKMYTWEKPFLKLVEIARKLEMDEIISANYCRLMILALKNLVTRMTLFSCVLTWVLTHVSLTPQYVFTVATFYEILRLSVTVYLSLTFVSYSEIIVSMQRIEEFLKNLSHQSGKFQKKIDSLSDLSVGIYAYNVTVKWNSSTPLYNLRQVTFDAAPGQLVAVVGTAGSGKSTLLQVILKEIDVAQGNIHVGGMVSYASQEPWIFSASVKQNILFGQEMDQIKYLRVIKACALEHDISLLPYGDRTLVGERGVMLSGGQKARINLARAIYRDADIYLLDDPLSAVDAHVSKQIFEECIEGYLKNKCVVLITHQLQYLRRVDKIYVFETGQIAASGTYKELAYLRGYFGEVSKQAPEVNKSEAVIMGEMEPFKNFNIPIEVQEQQSSGTTSAKVYRNYCFAGGKWGLTFLTVVLYALVQALGNSVDYFVAFLVNLEQDRMKTSNNSNYLKFFTTENNLLIYSMLLIILIVLIAVRCWAFAKFSTNASKILHNVMLTKVIHGTMKIFDISPSGRILNRFSKDLGSVDEQLPMTLADVITVFLNIVGITVLVCIVNHWMLIPTIMLYAVCYFYSLIYVATVKNVIRIEAIRRSPLFSYLATSIRGLTTIRAFNAQKNLKTEFDNHQDNHTSAFYLQLALHHSLNFWMDIICVIYVGTLIFSFFINETETYVGSIGLAIMQAVPLVGMIPYGLRQWSNLDIQITSLERIVEYTELTPEVDEDGKTLPELWPSEGNIEFQTVHMQYSPDDPNALHQVSFEVKGGEKVGIVGRTGAGKSSLLSALLRLYYFDGKIIIDGVNIKDIHLNDLRSKISVIPQDPVLFQGTLRRNLDPFDEYTDSQIWHALEEVGLKSTVSKMSLGLETAVWEEGSNFSLGQKQLLCLVRAMVRSCKIIVFDEATANIDLKTDQLIQSVIRRKFKDCTVLTIAHRLHTVMDSDKVLVMDAGCVVEFDHPYRLLQNTSGILYSYVNRSGLGTAENLMKIAKRNFFDRFKGASEE